MSGNPKRHHFVPQVYLRAWADDRGQLSVRRRDLPQGFVTGVKNVALENGLYGSGAQAEDREARFSAQEGTWVELREALVGDDARDAQNRRRFAAFTASQRLRTREQRAQEDFFDRAAKAILNRPVSHSDMATFLSEVWGVDNPSSNEIDGACDLLNGVINMQGGDEDFPRIDSFDIPGHVDRVTEELLKGRWHIEHCHAAVLITSDTPVILWRRRSDRDSIEGLAMSDAEEIWFPLDPRRLLVIGPKSGKSGRSDVPRRRFEKVNREIAARCFESVIGSPDQAAYLATLPMAAQRPALRFNRGPLFERSWDGSDLYRGDVIHTWVPSHDGV